MALVDMDECIRGYLQGAFPMDDRTADDIEFYVSDPRAILPLDTFRVPRTVARRVRHGGFELRLDTAFDTVVERCGGFRAGGEWLTPRLADLYADLHEAGYAHSVEAWQGGELAGGLFGVALGGLFTSESMFHDLPDGGNAALVLAHHHLTARGFVLWDIQMSTDHTRRFGVRDVAHEDYVVMLRAAVRTPVTFLPPRRG